VKLSELIEQTLSEIANGIENAKTSSNHLIAISPHSIDGKPVSEMSYIEFDVSIAVTEKSDSSSSSERGGGGEIKVLSIAGLNGKSSSRDDEANSISSQLTHRISFKVPVCMSGKVLN
jgi:transcriptional regulator CtsR